MKYLFITSLPFSNDKNKLANIIIIAPAIFIGTGCSFKKMKLNMIKNTVDSCFNILNVDGSRPYLASVFNLSVAAYIIVTINNVMYIFISVGKVNLKNGMNNIAQSAVPSSNKMVRQFAFFIVLFVFLNTLANITADIR
ncbi:MAG: hypothetical protein IJ475_01045 [Bacilli bacterium]|nr:hypothetical protein [Bacilli bacterium]